MLPRDLEHRGRSDDIHVRVPRRVAKGRAYACKAREMDDAMQGAEAKPAGLDKSRCCGTVRHVSLDVDCLCAEFLELGNQDFGRPAARRTAAERNARVAIAREVPRKN